MRIYQPQGCLVRLIPAKHRGVVYADFEDELGELTHAELQGRPLAGHPTGRYVDAHEWVVASFLQHTSRDGDPQLHVHNAILNRAPCEDGTWRTIDSRGLHKARAVVSAVGGRVMDDRSLGAAYAQRPDGHGRELTGVPQQVKELFSSRRAAITSGVAELAAGPAREPAGQASAPDRGSAERAGPWAPPADQISVLAACLENADPDLSAERTPRTGDPQTDRYLHELAALMDQRVIDFGELAAADPSAWAVAYLGPVPGDPMQRQEWAAKAGIAAAYRERYGRTDPREAIGREPAAPEARADWHAARAALGIPRGQAEITTAPAGELWARRARYERELAWAPPHVGDQLRATAHARREHATQASLIRAQAGTASPRQRARQLARAPATG